LQAGEAGSIALGQKRFATQHILRVADGTQGRVVAATLIHKTIGAIFYRADDFENSPERRADYGKAFSRGASAAVSEPLAGMKSRNVKLESRKPDAKARRRQRASARKNSERLICSR
jgi:hypothetical protein